VLIGVNNVRILFVKKSAYSSHYAGLIRAGYEQPDCVFLGFGHDFIVCCMSMPMTNSKVSAKGVGFAL
jgi:hypothetical protein